MVYLRFNNKISMQHSRLNHIQRYIIIQNIVREKYDPDVTTYAGIWRKYVYPIYPMSYHRFIEVINMAHLNELLAIEKQRIEEKRSGNQLALF